MFKFGHCSMWIRTPIIVPWTRAGDAPTGQRYTRNDADIALLPRARDLQKRQGLFLRYAVQFNTALGYNMPRNTKAFKYLFEALDRPGIAKLRALVSKSAHIISTRSNSSETGAGIKSAGPSNTPIAVSHFCGPCVCHKRRHR